MKTVQFRVCKASAHGLGFLLSPAPDIESSAGAPGWVVEAWSWILHTEAGLPADTPSWFSLPAMMRFTITTTHVLKVLQNRQRELPYRDRAKPFNFIVSPLIDRFTGHPIDVDRHKFTLVGQFSNNPSEWFDIDYVNVHDGKSYRLGRPGIRMSYEAEANSYGDFVKQYRWHPEFKSLGPDGQVCARETHGLLQRCPVTAVGVPRCIGKETDRRWEQGEDISMLDTFTLEYRPNETENLVTDPALQVKVRSVSIRTLARAAGVSEKTVKAARDGKRLRKHTIDKLTKALNSQPVIKKPDKPACDPPFTLDD